MFTLNEDTHAATAQSQQCNAGEQKRDGSKARGSTDLRPDPARAPARSARARASATQPKRPTQSQTAAKLTEISLSEKVHSEPTTRPVGHKPRTLSQNRLIRSKTGEEKRADLRPSPAPVLARTARARCRSAPPRRPRLYRERKHSSNRGNQPNAFPSRCRAKRRRINRHNACSRRRKTAACPAGCERASHTGANRNAHIRARSNKAGKATNLSNGHRRESEHRR